MKKIYITSLFLIFTTFLFSQKETNNWIFGTNNWLDFNTSPPTVRSGEIDFFLAHRSTISMSDKDGNLLFTSNGDAVFDRNHNVMPNGMIKANMFESHPVFVIPKPNSEHIYYLIINTFESPTRILKWVEIDMSLNNGLGDIITNTNSGGFLLENPTGKITAVLHENLIDVWIISHVFNSDEYYAWLATESGINPTPVITSIGIEIPNEFQDNGNGQIKTSSDGNTIASANIIINNVEIYNINRATGELYNLITLNQLFSPRGVEFSPSGQYLYVTHEGFQGDSRILQYDLWAGNESAINNSKLSVGNPISANTAAALQLAPNGKIYCVNFGDPALGIINAPDNNGFNVNFEQEGQGDIVDFSFFGLPSFFHKYFDKPYFSYDGVCSGSTTTFLIDGFDASINSVTWDFGDPASGTNNSSTELNPSHNYPASGNYYVTLTITSNNQTFTKKQLVHIAPTSINIGIDSTLCSNQNLTADAFTPNATYEWSNGFTTSAIDITSPGAYSVTVSVANCPTLTDEVVVNHIPAPDADLGGDGALCNGESVTLDATNLGASYLWSTGSTLSTITAFFSDTYAVTVTNPNGCSDVDEVVYVNDFFALGPSQANLKCFNDSSGVALVFHSGGFSPISYQWNNGDTLYTNNHLTAGNYSVTATDRFGCTTEQGFTLTEPDELIVDLVTNADNPNTGIFEGSVLLQPSGGNPPYTFDWEMFGETTDPLKTGLENGIYNITITDDNGCEKIIQANVGNVTSIEEISFLKKVKLFPNPTSDFLFIKIPNKKNGNFQFSITDILGKTMLEKSFLENEKTEFSIDVKNWSSGIYFFKIKMEGAERVWKVNVVK